MRFDILTIFPEFFRGPLDYGIVRRAREARLAQVEVHDLRRWTRDRHRSVDDRPFGGGEGMVLKPEPIFEAVEELIGFEPGKFFAADRLHRSSAQNDSGGKTDAKGPAAEAAGYQNTAIVLLSPAGKLFRQQTARRLAQLDRVVLICGRYEGVDERVAEHLATDELSVGDFVLSGGELPAAMIVDAVTRLLPGALGNEASSVFESFSAAAPEEFAPDSAGKIGEVCVPNAECRASGAGILDCPHYTRPQEFRGWTVPEVLISGHHAEVRRWRRKMALGKTLRNRPELLAAAALSKEDRVLLEELRTEAAARTSGD